MIFHCLIGFDDGYVGKCDGIEHDGKLWLVPGWLRHETKKHAIPKRMVRFDNLQHQKSNEGDCKYVTSHYQLKKVNSQMGHCLAILNTSIMSFMSKSQ